MRHASIIVLLVLFPRARLGAEAPAARAALALVGGQIVDGFEGRPIPDGAVPIRGQRILAVGPRSEVAIPAGTPTIGTRGMTVLPEKEIGALAPGHHADVIAVRGDVLAHLGLLQNVDVVVKNGVRIK